MTGFDDNFEREILQRSVLKGLFSPSFTFSWFPIKGLCCCIHCIASLWVVLYVSVLMCKINNFLKIISPNVLAQYVIGHSRSYPVEYASLSHSPKAVHPLPRCRHRFCIAWRQSRLSVDYLKVPCGFFILKKHGFIYIQMFSPKCILRSPTTQQAHLIQKHVVVLNTVPDQNISRNCHKWSKTTQRTFKWFKR